MEKDVVGAKTVTFTSIPEMLLESAKLKKEGWIPEGYPDMKGSSINQLFIKEK